MKKYQVTIEMAEGTCEKANFKKLAENGDIQAEPISKQIGRILTITGFSKCHVAAGDKEFDVYYYACDDGYYSSGSEYFKESVEKYFDDTHTFKIKLIETKKGHTFKATPIFDEVADNE